jgi:hypothetical protein
MKQKDAVSFAFFNIVGFNVSQVYIQSRTSQPKTQKPPEGRLLPLPGHFEHIRKFKFGAGSFLPLIAFARG